MWERAAAAQSFQAADSAGTARSPPSRGSRFAPHDDFAVS